MPILRERIPTDGTLIAKPEDEDSDELEEWVALDDGRFQCTRAATANEATADSPRRQRSAAAQSNVRTFVAAAIIAVVAYALARGSAFWCGARGIPLGTLFRTAGFSLAQMPDLSGQTALITGANTGLGFEVAKQLAAANASVILGCRDMRKCAAAAATLRDRFLPRGRPPEAVQTLHVDLSDLQAVAHAARKVGKLTRSLSMLILNAGVATQFPTLLTVDGVERTFQANFVGHFLLATRLLPLLERTGSARAPARIVHLTSGAHRGAPPEGVPLNLDTINAPTMGAYARYGMAKLASLALSNEMARRQAAAAGSHRAPRVLSHAVHPGVVATEMLRAPNFARMLGFGVGHLAWLIAQARNLVFAYSARTAALSVLYAAAAAPAPAPPPAPPQVELVGVPPQHERRSSRGTVAATPANTGTLIVPIATRWPAHHPMADDAAFGKALWEFSDGLVRRALKRRRVAPGR